MYGTGRIGEIKKAIEDKYGANLLEIAPIDKLDALCVLVRVENYPENIASAR